MPKINVYLPDDLAESVRAANLPVSAICQRALEGALRHLTALQEGAAAGNPDLPAEVQLGGPATPRLKAAISLAYDAARARAVNYVGTEHLLLGLLDEGGNLAIRVVEAMDVEPADLRAELDATIGTVAGHGGEPALTLFARRVIVNMTEEAVRLGHNYLGCEHLLLALVAEPEGLAGRVLRSLGISSPGARRAVVTALSGFVHGRAQPAPTTERLLGDVLARLERLEKRLESA